jgi:Replication-relaxation
MAYALADRGARLLAESGSECANPAVSRNNHRAGRPFIDHQLEIIEFSVTLELSFRRYGDIRLIHSDELVVGFPEATRARRNPLGLLATIAHEGETQEIGIVPDLVFGIEFRDRSRRCFMVEIDRGTMPITRSDIWQSSFERKMCGYLAAYAARQHEQQFGWKAFRVLTVTTDQCRLNSMVKALGSLSVPHSPGPGLFWFGLRQELNRSNPIEFAWRDGAGQIRHIV